MVDKRKITSHNDLRDEFVAGMERILCDIFDREKPFMPSADEKNCGYCRYKYLCGRE